MFERFSIVSSQCIFAARLEAGRVGATTIDTEHFLIGVARSDPALMERVAPTVTLVRLRELARIWHTPGEQISTSTDMPLADDAKAMLDKAVVLAEAHKSSFVRTEHLLLALLSASASHSAAILDGEDVSVKKLEELVGSLNREEQQQSIEWWTSEELGHS